MRCSGVIVTKLRCLSSTVKFNIFLISRVMPCRSFGGMGKMTTAEVTKEQFDDLIHDRIAPWRLKEAGFVPFPDEHNTAMMRWENDAQYTVEVIGGGVYVNNASYNITTFTDLLTLIKFLTPTK